MKICKIIIPNFQQFQDFELDLTYPQNHSKAGKPLDKVCFIGSNGTGKSTLLNLLQASLKTMSFDSALFTNKVTSRTSFSEKIIIKVETKEDKFYFTSKDGFPQNNYFLNELIENEKDWLYDLKEEMTRKISSFTISTDIGFKSKYGKYIFSGENFLFKNNSNDLIIYSPAESNENQLLSLNDIPQTTLNDALNLFKEFNFFHEVSNSQIKEFWKILIYLIKKREEDYRRFENFEDNQNKTIKKVKDEFNIKYPEILKSISELWNKLLDKVGLAFDYESANNPIQLNDNLRAYIKLKSNNELIKYSDLSTGIRNFIFRIGFIHALYFNREIDKGILLIDEPENSLYPDFLYDLIGIYESTIHNTQFFVATHSPIIAAQFEPEERIILSFAEDGKVIAHRGVTPIGDDANDILLNDFNVRSIFGKEGLEKWERFIELKNMIKNEQDNQKKINLMEEYLKIGSAYNFSNNEIFSKKN